MATNTLNSPRIVGLLDRLFTVAEASEPALEAVAQSDASHLITSKTDYRQFYGLLKDVPLPVSRETGYLLYVLARSARAESILEFGTSFGFRQSIWLRLSATMEVVESSRQSLNLPRRRELAKT